jgi:hypothetical protein
MSLDDRLRAGLEANAVDFLPEGEARLAQVHVRLRRRRALQSWAAVGSVAAAVAITVAVLGTSRPSNDRPEPVPQPTQTPTSTQTAYDGPRIPNSTWTKEVTRADARAAGISDQNPFIRDFGADGVLPLTLKYEADSYSVLVTNDQGSSEVGDFGTLVYDAPGRLTMTSGSPGCPGCEYPVTWEIRGDRLVLAAAPGASIPKVDGFVLLDTWLGSD